MKLFTELSQRTIEKEVVESRGKPVPIKVALIPPLVPVEAGDKDVTVELIVTEVKAETSA